MPATLLTLSAPGRFAIGEDCEGCGQCLRFAPGLVAFDAAGRFALVVRQPGTEAERRAMEQARRFCPTRALVEAGGD